MVLPHSSTQKYLFTLGGQFAAARGGQYDRLLHYTIQGLKVENGTVSNGQTIGLELKLGLYLLAVKNTEGTFSQTIKIIKL